MTLQVEDVVVYVDTLRKKHNALVTAIHGDPEDNPSINLLIVSDDKNKGDEYGRQIERQSSVVHNSNQTAGANCWYKAP